VVVDFPNKKSEEDFLGRDSEILKEKADVSLNILIGEDDVDLAEIYSEILSARGHRIKLTFDGLQCVRTYEHLQDKAPFDVVILDYLMPRKSGSQTAREILQKNSNQRIIFISAFGKKLLEDIEGIEDKIEFLTKPTRSGSLIEVIEKGHLWKAKPKKTTENWNGNIKWSD
jgi:two-component system cell cycle response regulator CpdR